MLLPKHPTPNSNSLACSFALELLVKCVGEQRKDQLGSAFLHFTSIMASSSSRKTCAHSLFAEGHVTPSGKLGMCECRLRKTQTLSHNPAYASSLSGSKQTVVFVGGPGERNLKLFAGERREGDGDLSCSHRTIAARSRGGRRERASRSKHARNGSSECKSGCVLLLHDRSGARLELRDLKFRGGREGGGECKLGRVLWVQSAHLCPVASVLTY